MTKKLAAIAFVAMLVPLMVGVPSCTSTDCTGFCQKEQACGGIANADCDTFCTDVSNMNDNAGCDDQFDELVTCFEELTDVCGDTSRCIDPGALYDGCWTAYCATAPTDPGCTALNQLRP
ncbi:MAG TPA: hypothetical protein VH560_15680 [Polyangia bacterium]|jgi:hypothetical protein|nr:hypothetical protein [Polyangia bacterium]